MTGRSAIGSIRFRGMVSRLLVLALLVPALLGLLPPLPPTQAFALDRDLAASICAGGKRGPAPAQHSHEQCCIPCGAGAAAVPPSDAATAVHPPRREAPAQTAALDGDAPAFPRGNWQSARGPPGR